MVVIRVKLEIICKLSGIIPGTYLYLLSIIIVISNKNNNHQGAKKTAYNKSSAANILSTFQVPGTIQWACWEIVT